MIVTRGNRDIPIETSLYLQMTLYNCLSHPIIVEDGSEESKHEEPNSPNGFVAQMLYIMHFA